MFGVDRGGNGVIRVGAELQGKMGQGMALQPASLKGGGSLMER